MELKFFELNLELLSPAIVATRRTKTGYVAGDKDYIPSSTLRGAILTALYRDGKLDEAFLRSEEALLVVASAAFPIYRGRKSYPCHPFAYRCKACASEGEEVGENYVMEVLPLLERGEEPAYKHSCSKGHVALEPLHPSPCIVVSKDGRRLVRADVGKHEMTCVGISRKRATSERNLLFEYEAVAAETEFWATLAVPDKLSRLIEDLGEIRVGRGVSRGFGRAKFKANPVSLEGLMEKYRELIPFKRGRLVLYSLSPMLHCSGNKYWPYPEEIDLSRFSKLCGMSDGGSLRIEAVYGRTGFYSAGWDILKNEERPTFSDVPSCGSIAVCFFSGEAEALVPLGLVGTTEKVGSFTITGVNMLMPIKGHPMGGGEAE